MGAAKPYGDMKAKLFEIVSEQEDLTGLMAALLCTHHRAFWKDTEMEPIKIVKALLKAGANVNVADPSNNSIECPGALAFSMGRMPASREVCKSLIKEGSDLQSKCFGSNSNMTIFERQEELGRSEWVAELKQYAASLQGELPAQLSP